MPQPIDPDLLRIAAAAQLAAYGGFATDAQATLNSLLGSSAWRQPSGFYTGTSGSNGLFVSSWSLQNGYYLSGDAAAFAAVNGDTLVLSFRGTDQGAPTLEHPLSELVTAAINIEGELRSLRAFVESAIAYVNTPANGIHRLIITGHSLGGELAEAVTALYGARFMASGEIVRSNIDLVTFGSPGLPPTLHNLDLDGNGQVSGPGELTVMTKLPPGLGAAVSYGNLEDIVFKHWEGASLLDALNFARGTTDLRANALDARPDQFTSLINPADYENKLLHDATEHDQHLYYQIWTEDANFEFLFNWQTLPDWGNLHTFALSTSARQIGGTLNDVLTLTANDLVLGMDGDDYLAAPSGSSAAFYASGGTGSDSLVGSVGSDFYDGGPGSDSIAAGGGDDRLSGGPGDDIIDGGAGSDVAEFSGAFANYRITANPNGTWTVQETGGDKADGVDVIKGVENLQFADRLVNLGAGRPLSNIVYVADDQAELFQIDLDTLLATRLGSTGTVMTDLAISPDGRLFGVSGSALFLLDPSSGSSTLIGALGIGGANAFTIDAQGVAYLAGNETLGTGALYRVNLSTGAASRIGGFAATSAGDLAFHNGGLFLSTTDGRIVQLDASTGSILSSHQAGISNLFGLAEYAGATYGLAGTSLYRLDLNTGVATSLGSYPASFMSTVFGATSSDFGASKTDLLGIEYANILRAQPTGGLRAAFDQLASQLVGGQLSSDDAIMKLVQMASATTSVATLCYEFFTGAVPGLAGIDYLVSPTGPNPNNLNSAYFQNFGMENRYINFAVNLGKLGEGKAQFAAQYGGLTLEQATKLAYGVIFGAQPSDTKVAALLAGGRDAYFEYYGQDGHNGIGTKAAMVGWLLAEAEKADLGIYAKANDAFLTDLADGATFAVDIVGSYGRSDFIFHPG